MTLSAAIVRSGSQSDKGFADIVEELTARLQAGDSVDLDAVRRDHPEHAERLEQLLPALRLLADVSRSRPDGLLAMSRAADSDPLAGTLGDFRLVRELGRGGMGVVYEAEQISLGRRVALKVLPFASTLDTKQLQRFKNEAQAAAQLHHTSIVPVYAVGVERGVHYYAMQFIEGQTLAQVIADLRLQIADSKKESRTDSNPLAVPADMDAPTGPYAPQSAICNPQSAITVTPPVAGLSTERSIRSPAHFQMVARLGIQAAEALEHAHQLGIVHRDIKPANLLVDGRGNLWITDFGLAHCQNQAGLTMSGDLVGTLRYMSPEQALGQRVTVDHHTDVYSLGATLYELLTLKPGFPGVDRQELLRQIAFEEPRPPRRINEAVPAELETIVLKALEKTPADRYATAQALADDLRRFLEDRPIRARRPTLGQKVKKWGRRNKGIVWTALAAAACLLLTLTLVAALGAVWLRKAWQVAEDRADQLQQDIESLKAANNLLDTGWHHANSRQWDQAEADFKQAAQRRPDHAFVWTARCDFHCRLGLWEWAADDSLQALQVQEFALPWFWYRHAVLRLQVGDTQGYRQACARMVERSGQTPDPDFAHELAHSCQLVPAPVVDPQRLVQFGERGTAGRHSAGPFCTLGVAHYRAGHYEQAIQFLSDSLNVDPQWSGRAQNHAVRAMAYHCLGWAGEARQELQSAAWVIDDLTQKTLRNEVGTTPSYWWCDLLASSVLYREAKMLIDGQPPPEDARLHVARARGFAAVKEKGQADAACAKAVELEPGSAAIRRECALVYANLGQWDEALLHLSKALELREADADLGSLWFPLAIAHWRAGDKDQARHWYGRAAQWMVRNRPQDAKLRRSRAEAAALLGIQDHRRFPGHTQQVRSAVFSPDGSRALSAGHDGTLRLWDVASGQELRCFRGHSAPVWSAALSPDGRRALSGGSDRTMRLWDVETGKQLLQFQHPPGCVMGVAFSPDGRRALSGSFRMVHLWELEAGKELARWEGHDSQVRAVAFSPDGRRALSGCQDNTVRLWDVATGKELRRFTGHEHWVLSVAFSPDGRQALSGGCDHTVRLWDVASAEQLGCFRGHQANAESVAFSPDGRRALSGSADGTIRLWDLPGGREVRCFGTEYVVSVAFSPDGRQVLSAHADNLVRLWSLPEELTDKATDGKKKD